MAIDRIPLPPPIFVGDHLALDFINSSSTPSGRRVEWLRDGAALVGWLAQAGAIDAAIAAKFRADDALDVVAGRARDLRTWLRMFVERHAGSELHADAVAELGPLNRVLARDDSYCQIDAREGDAVPDDGVDRHALRRRRVQRWTTPEQLLQPIAEAIGDLVCGADFRLVRACEGHACTLMFLDRTKAHRRRWCSMGVCGNRAKAAAHRARARGP